MRAWSLARGALARFVDDVLGQEPAFLVLRMTLVLLLLHGAQSWHLTVSLRVICAITILSPALTGSALVWLVLSLAMVWSNAVDWLLIDNHKYLITYWCLVCSLALASGQAQRVLKHNARLLIGLCFGLAVVWKALTADFADGSFLYMTFLTDSRVFSVSELIGSLGMDELVQNRMLLRSMTGAPVDGMSVALNGDPGLWTVTRGMALWTFAIEGAVAAAFLWWRRGRLDRWRNTLLIVFVLTTYFVLPVSGFAFALAVLGFAQCDPLERRARVAYLGLLMLIPFIQVPWASYASSLING